MRCLTSLAFLMWALLECYHCTAQAVLDPKHVQWWIFTNCCLVAEQVSYYLPGYLPPEQIFVPPSRASDSIIMGAYAEQGLAFEGQLKPH